MATALGSIACAPMRQAYSQSGNCSYASSSLQKKKASVLSSVCLPKHQRYPTQYPTLTTTSITTTKSRGGGSSQSSSLLPVTATISKEKEVAEGRGIEQNMLEEKPATLLRETQSDAVNNLQLRAQFEQMAFRVQIEVCTAVEAVDGGKFREEAWSGEGGRGFGRVLQNGTVWEKAGVNVSVLSGIMSPEAYRAATGTTGVANEAGAVPFYASGVTSVMHPRNPFAPSVHFNYRYFETEGVEGAPRVWWFGGGTDLTPSYLFEEDVKHFHEFQKKACDKFDPAFYPKFKSWCDDYFLVKHRAERRGLGGIFFDNLNDRDPEQLLAFATACADTVIPAYIPLVEKRKDTPFSEPQKDWQQLRRGRYVEFNLVHDRGTAFGLKMGVRIESILMPLPLTARWEYDHHPKENSDEWKLLEACKNPRDWV